MRISVAALPAALFLAFPSTAVATDGSSVVTQVERSVVWVQVGEDGGCSAFVINAEKHYLLTAAHCKPREGQALWTDNVQASVVFLDPKRDLMVVEAKYLDPSRPA